MINIRPNQIMVAGSYAGTALHDLRLIPISRVDAKKLIVRNHYSHSLPGGTKMSFWDGSQWQAAWGNDIRSRPILRIQTC